MQLNLKTAKVLKAFQRRHRSVEFLQFPDAIDAAVPKYSDVHLVMDNYVSPPAVVDRFRVRRLLTLPPFSDGCKLDIGRFGVIGLTLFGERDTSDIAARSKMLEPSVGLRER